MNLRRLRTSSHAGFECVDGTHLAIGEFEVEESGVLGDAVRVRRLRDRRTTLLDVPTKHDLRGALPMGSCNAGDHAIFERAAVYAVHVEGDTPDRRPSLRRDAVLSVERLHGALLEVRMNLEKYG